MKKITFLFLTLLISFLGYSQTEYLDGVLVLNEGGYNGENASISYISATNQLTNNINETANPGILFGDTAQCISMYNDIAVVVLNGYNQVKILNNRTFQEIDTIEDFVNPRYSAVYNNKAYVTCWGTSYDDPGYLAVIDLTTNTWEETIDLTNGPERIIEANGRIYIAHLFSNVISVYDPVTDTLEEITVNDRPSALSVIGSDLYVLCGLYSWAPALVPAKLFKINTTTNAITSSHDFPEGLKMFRMDTNGTDLIIASENDIYNYSVSTQTLNETPIISTDISGAYGIYGLNVIDNTIYVADAGNYVSPGKAYTYSIEGTLLNTFTVGVIPNGFYKTKDSPLAIDKHNKVNVKIYPNPTSDILNIQTDEQLVNVEVYTLQGQKVLSTNNVTSIDVSSLQTGVYLLKAQTTNGISSHKFIKK